MLFTPTSLVEAVERLFKLNQYDVKLSQKIYGAEIDMCVRHKGDQFAKDIYIELTTEYVDNTKYGKDTTKFILIKEIEPQAACMIISSEGFTIDVIERATKSRIETLTYIQLANKFEQFTPYLEKMLGDTMYSKENEMLNKIYEEPFFVEGIQKEKVLIYLDKWKVESKDNKWLFIVGDYGTGKTALTKVIHRRWLIDYQQDRSKPIPIRIELRDFNKQFDSRGLIHHFLDDNGLGYISIDYIFELIKSSRIILILDGYDEMAQYMNSRERKTCLEALVDLSTGGAKGIITSRPNYFTEAEELQIFSILYRDLLSKVLVLSDEKKEVEKKLELNSFVQHHFSERIEKKLKDLDKMQTISLVKRVLVDDKQGQESVISIIENIFASSKRGEDDIELSGKPVIITYLMDVVEELKSNDKKNSTINLNLWKIYELIIDMLMFRDFKRSENITPDERRRFLHELSIYLSSEASIIYETELKKIVEKVFDKEIKRLQYTERENYLDVLFSDMRSSTTLTRFQGQGESGWRFSHNTLKEYLACESIRQSLANGEIITNHIKYTDLMKDFFKSLGEIDLTSISKNIASTYLQSNGISIVSKVFNLLFPALVAMHKNSKAPHDELLTEISNRTKNFQGTEWDHISVGISSHEQNFNGYNFSESIFTAVVFKFIIFENVNFSYSLFDSCRFLGCQFNNMAIKNSEFSACTFISCNFNNTRIEINKDNSSLIVDINGMPIIQKGDYVLGYFKYNGAILNEDVAKYYEVIFDVRYSIVEKISQRLFDQSIGQIRGLTQRGAASKDISFSKKYLEFLMSNQYVKIQRKENVEVTEKGRSFLSKLLINHEVENALYQLFKNKT